MTYRLCSKILSSIEGEIKNVLKEQFSISDLDFSDDNNEYNINIFNKTFTHPYYQKILDGTITRNEINELNSLISIATPKNKNELRKIIEFYSNNYPENYLNWLDVSRITDMSHLFENTKYNGDISKWYTSNVTDMSYMFNSAKKFNQHIGDWDVSNVTNMQGMFQYAYKFNQPIGDWDVSMVTDMENMFYFAYNFDQPIGNWDVSHVTNMECMFYEAYKFNQDISKWNISDNTKINDMFSHCSIILLKYIPVKINL